MRDDDRLPDELRQVADSLRESRTEPTPLRLDELKMRALRQADQASGRSAGPWRKKLVAVMLTLGLMLTSSTGVVVAAQSLGSKARPKFSYQAFKQKVTKPKKDASKSQYCPPTKHDGSDSDSARDSDSDSDCDRSDSDGSDDRSDRDRDSD